MQQPRLTRQAFWTVVDIGARALGSLCAVDTGEGQEKVRKPWPGEEGKRNVLLLSIYYVPGNLNIFFQ